MPSSNDLAGDKPEVLEVHGRRTQRRWTAKAGGLAGLLIGFLLAVGVGYFNQMRYQQAANDALRGHAQACLKTIKEKESALELAQSAMRDSARGGPVLELQKAQSEGLQRLTKLAAEFPAFKTEAYKLVADKLNAELKSQTTAASALSALLEQGYRSDAPLCAVKAKVLEGEQSLWARGAIALYKDGWLIHAPTHPTPAGAPGGLQ